MAERIGIAVYRQDAKSPAQSRITQAAHRFFQEPGDWEMAKNAMGKPQFSRATGRHLSISHSQSYWICALGTCPLGVDLQLHRPARMQEIAKRWFHPMECEYLQACDYRDFFEIWAAKESYAKLTGKGIDKDFSKFSVANGEKITSTVNGASLYGVEFLPGYSLYVCSKAPAQLSLWWER